MRSHEDLFCSHTFSMNHKNIRLCAYKTSHVLTQAHALCRTKVKARVQLADGSWAERIPAWIKWATQEWNEIQYNGVYYEPQVPL